MKKTRSVLWDLRILLVEDEELPRQIMEKKLSLLCEHVDAVADGEEAYTLYQERYYDLIVTDLEMPNRDGFWLIEKIRQDSFQKPILVITAYTDIHHVRRCLDLGVSSFISKPIETDKLYQTLYHFGVSLHEKKVMYEYQKELERHTNTCRKLSKQYTVLQNILSEVLSDEIKATVAGELKAKKESVPRFLRLSDPQVPQKEESPRHVETPPVQTAQDHFAYDEFKADDMQKFYEAEEDIRDYLSEMFMRPELSHEVFHKIAPQIEVIGENLSKYPHYVDLSVKLTHLASVLEKVAPGQELKKFNYLFESFMDTLGEWCHVVLGNGSSEEKTADIYSVMHDVDILINAIEGGDLESAGELELF